MINICSSPAARRERRERRGRRGRTKTNESRCWLTVLISWCWCGPWSTWILLQLKEFFYVRVHVHFQFPFCSFFHPSSLLYCTYLTLPPLSFLLLHFLYHFSNHIVPLELHQSIDSRVKFRAPHHPSKALNCPSTAHVPILADFGHSL